MRRMGILKIRGRMPMTFHPRRWIAFRYGFATFRAGIYAGSKSWPAPTLGVPRPKEVQSSLRGRLRLIYSRNLLPRGPCAPAIYFTTIISESGR